MKLYLLLIEIVLALSKYYENFNKIRFKENMFTAQKQMKLTTQNSRQDCYANPSFLLYRQMCCNCLCSLDVVSVQFRQWYNLGILPLVQGATPQPITRQCGIHQPDILIMVVSWTTNSNCTKWSQSLRFVKLYHVVLTALCICIMYRSNFIQMVSGRSQIIWLKHDLLKFFLIYTVVSDKIQFIQLNYKLHNFCLLFQASWIMPELSR